MLATSNLWYRYPTALADWTLRGIDLKVGRSELVGLVGPSGCGKTTLLRLIAGFERPVKGTISLNQQILSSAEIYVPAERRDIGMVFQDAALFPHLTAWQNACFGLSPRQSRQRVEWLLELVGIAGFAKRYPHELSGGQRQRLALVRSLATAPQLLLLDEPFSNLDVEVRLRLRQELPSVLKECGTAALMVTHDPEEALAICDQVAVIKAGSFEQIGPPQSVIREPATEFVGTFLAGENLIPLCRDREGWSTPLGRIRFNAVDTPCTDTHQDAQQGAASLMVSPRNLMIEGAADGAARVISREFLGQQWRYRIDLEGLTYSVICSLEAELLAGERCRLVWRPGANARAFPWGLPVVL